MAQQEPINDNGLTFSEFSYAATAFCRDPHIARRAQASLLDAWLNNEDPTDWGEFLSRSGI